MIQLLTIVFLLLLYWIGKERGLITLKSLGFNLAILCVLILLMSHGWNPVLVTFPSCLIICYITLFYQNGWTAKTMASFAAVLFILSVLFLIAYYIGQVSHLGGINEIMRNEDEIAMLSPYINMNMNQIAVSVIITGLIGAALDASVAVASAVYEVYINNRDLCLAKLFQSGLHIGSDVLGATMNTLYFACLGESLTLFILFKNYHYTILEVINSKAFCQEFVILIFSCTACILVIPLTAVTISYILKNLNRFEKYLLDEELFFD
ncbi:YibE/F family protein [Aminipila butyrica]|uniref:YibE/F family protein n=1 Tax=Aminipila butyrica TaxID=433296 RepID=A0A858C0E2_9FIRM|nr:YibE/F family protein [Aminipila butyrica]QIB70534.1 YibE/F family protein [Aminipila butyrica]